MDSFSGFAIDACSSWIDSLNGPCNSLCEDLCKLRAVSKDVKGQPFWSRPYLGCDGSSDWDMCKSGWRVRYRSYKWMCVYIHTHTYIYIYIYMYTYIHTYIHTYICTDYAYLCVVMQQLMQLMYIYIYKKTYQGYNPILGTRWHVMKFVQAACADHTGTGTMQRPGRWALSDPKLVVFFMFFMIQASLIPNYDINYDTSEAFFWWMVLETQPVARNNLLKTQIGSIHVHSIYFRPTSLSIFFMSRCPRLPDFDLTPALFLGAALQRCFQAECSCFCWFLFLGFQTSKNIIEHHSASWCIMVHHGASSTCDGVICFGSLF